jgi:hypothetical protein
VLSLCQLLSSPISFILDPKAVSAEPPLSHVVVPLTRHAQVEAIRTRLQASSQASAGKVEVRSVDGFQVG